MSGRRGVRRHRAAAGARPGLGIDVFASLRRRALSIGLDLEAGPTGPGNDLGVGLFAAKLAPCAHLGPLFGCAVGELGWAQAWGSGAAGCRSDGSPFVAVGGRAGLDVAISETVFARLGGDLLAELYGPEFGIRCRRSPRSGQT